MDWQALSTILSAIILLIGGAFIYRWQKLVDRNESLVVQRRTAYLEYLNSLSDFIQYQNKDKAVLLAEKQRKLVLLGSDQVLEHILHVHEGVIRGTIYGTPFNKQLLALIRAMRIDCFRKTHIPTDALSYISGIGRNVPIQATNEGHFEPEDSEGAEFYMKNTKH
mgnify:CR=1 FL=1